MKTVYITNTLQEMRDAQLHELTENGHEMNFTVMEEIL